MIVSNVYELLNNKQYDHHTITTNHFVLQPHQVIPKYYILSNPSIHSLVIHYSLGSGKTSTGVFTLLYNLDMFRMYTFSLQYAPKSSIYSRSNIISRNVIVVGAWQTKAQFKIELLRPEFNIASESTIREINELLNSPIEEQRSEGEQRRQRILNQLDKMIRFQGYQSFFNSVFPGRSSEEYNQNIDALVQEYNRGNLSVSSEFIKSARNSIIIVDEMQRLYSSTGLNSYGFAVACVSKIAKANGIKMMFLTGTMINSSLGEVPDILSVISGENRFYTRDEMCVEDIILDNVKVYRLRPDVMDKVREMFRKNFMYYNHAANDDVEGKPEMITLEELRKRKVWVSEVVDGDGKSAKDTMNGGAKGKSEMKAIVFPQKQLLPLEIHIGNRVIEDVNEPQPMVVYAVEVEGLQAKKYEDYIRSNVFGLKADDDKETKKAKTKGKTKRMRGGNVMSALESSATSDTSTFHNLVDVNLEENESDTVMHIHDAFIPDSSQWSSHHIYESDNVLRGSFLSLANIRRYSALAYELTRICLSNSLHHEKTVVYHDKINAFGIKQYCAVLDYNGFIAYGSSPNLDSICKYCGHPYRVHSRPVSDRIANHICSQFRGLYYGILSGDLTQDERNHLTNNLYNNPNNLRGDIISVMFVSDVAYSGISFFSTQNLIVLSRVPNVSKWKQIYARIIRTRSHSLLPDREQYTKIITFVIVMKDELTKYPALGRYTVGERYYKIRSILNKDVEEFTTTLANDCVSKQLFESPSTYPITKHEVTVTSELFNTDLENEIGHIIRRIVIDRSTAVWTLTTLVNRIKDPHNALTFLNLSTIKNLFIENLLIKNKLMTLFRYDNDDTVYVNMSQLLTSGETMKESDGSIVSSTEKTMVDNLSTISFALIGSLDLSKSNLNNVLGLLEKETRYSNKLVLLAKVMKLVNKKYNLLIGRKVFWDTMYEIGNEYYEDDETEFVKNHCRKNRNRSKCVGCYFGQEVIMMDGTSKIINYSFPAVTTLGKMPFKFKITCLALSESSPFYIHVNVIRVNDGEVKDRRKENKGLVCTSMDVTQLYEWFPNIDRTLHKKSYCRELVYEICEMQSKNAEVKFVYTPFEK